MPAWTSRQTALFVGELPGGVKPPMERKREEAKSRCMRKRVTQLPFFGPFHEIRTESSINKGDRTVFET